MSAPNLDEILVKLEAYEPAGTSIEMTARDLLGHTLVMGGSGAGKTTCIIQPIVDQLIRKNLEARLSICILDTKADGETEKFVRTSSFSSEREDEIVVISENSEYCLDLLEPLREEGIKGAAKLADILSYLIPECPSNRYWEVTLNTLLNHTIRLYLLLGHELKYSKLVRFIGDYLLRFDSDEMNFRDLDGFLQTQFEEGIIQTEERYIHEARASHKMWERLDFRTKSNLQSMVAPLVSLLNKQTAVELFGEGSPASIEGACNNTGILLLSVDSIREPEVARLAGTLLKARFYESICKRAAYTDAPIAILVMDDWIQSANHGSGTRYSDADALSLIRSRNGGILASAQGLAGLDLAIGPYSRRAVLANFSNLFFFRSRDSELDALAGAYLGETIKTLKDTAKFERISASQRRSLPVEYYQRDSSSRSATWGSSQATDRRSLCPHWRQSLQPTHLIHPALQLEYNYIMNTEDNEPIPYPIDDAHWEALQRINPDDRQIGRLPCYDYVLEFQRILGEPLPPPNPELLGFLGRCKTLKQVPYEHRITKQLFADSDCPMPEGMEDLPVIWACGIRRFVREMLWVDRDTERLRQFFDWNVVLRQEAFLEINFNEAVPIKDWPKTASLILEFHRFLEPCGMTEPGRLKEFF